MDNKSGLQWVTWAEDHAPHSASLTALAPGFKENVEKFITALEKGGATVTINETTRSPIRAYLFHWSWLIATGKCKPSEVPAMDGVDILWDHAGANAMVNGFGLAMPPRSNEAPALHSKHISGEAIDMKIAWTGKIKVAKSDGQEVEITYQDDPDINTALIEVGKSYGVYKNLHDRPHWSDDGR